MDAIFTNNAVCPFGDVQLCLTYFFYHLSDMSSASPLFLLPFFQSLRSICIKFLCHGAFPSIRFEYLLNPRHAGGLAILDPHRQQLPLQLRWLLPLFYTSHPFSSFVHPWLLAALSAHTPPSSNLLLCLLFPSLRSGPLTQSTSTLGLLCRAMDVFPRDFRACFVSVDTALSLQLQDVCVPAPATSLPSRLARPDLLVSDAFIFDPVLGFVRRRLNHELTGFPILVRHFYKALDMSTLSLSPPFFRLCLPSNWLPGFAPPAKSFSIHPYLDHLSQLASRPLYRSSPQHFCKLATATLQRPPAHILLRPTIWRRFWRLSISHIARNIWFRALHRRLPVRQLLHSINASRFPTPHCPVCLSESEDLEHFLMPSQVGNLARPLD